MVIIIIIILIFRYIRRLKIAELSISLVHSAIPFQRLNGIVFVPCTNCSCMYFQVNFHHAAWNEDAV